MEGGGLTGFIVRHLNVSYWVAASIKYIFLFVVIFGAGLSMKASYDKNKRQEGYDKCQSQYAQALESKKELSENTLKVREETIDKGKSEQRNQDSVSRATYNALKRQKDNDKIEFERALKDARNNTSSDNCANIDMPISLQRRVKPKTNSN